MHNHILKTGRLTFIFLACLAATSSAIAQTANHDQKKQQASQHGLQGYFDAHNHGYNGILPYYAFADLQAFIKHPNDPGKVDLEHRRRLWTYLVTTFAGDDQQPPPPTGPGNRIAPGAIATFRAYGIRIDKLSREQINGALQRVLTSTPWTEFDSAYALRGSISDQYLPTLFGGPLAAGYGLCDASILELAITHTAYSEQFLSFVGGWGKLTHGHSAKMDIIHCFISEPKVLAASGRLKGLPVPEIKVLLMTHTSELGATTDGKQWIQFATTGQCAPWQGAPLSTPPETIRYALLGKNADGTELLPSDERQGYLDTVIGIDTAAPEITCFTDDNQGQGMERYKAFVKAVYAAAKERRAAGWHGKLLVHTHVGEGGSTYRMDVPARKEGNDAESTAVFRSFPQIWMDPATQKPMHVEQSARNVKLLIAAVEELKSEISDLDDYVVLRFGHVTNADMDDAMAMKRLGIEADINLESNISTGAYYVPSLRPADNSLVTERQQFEYNDLPAVLRTSGHAQEMLAAHAFKYMLMAGVRTLMGSDGGGEENSAIGREYKLAEEMIAYWKTHDQKFPQDLPSNVIYTNVQQHLADMASDTRVGHSAPN